MRSSEIKVFILFIFLEQVLHTTMFTTKTTVEPWQVWAFGTLIIYISRLGNSTLLLVLLTGLLSYVLPYNYRLNDDGATRRAGWKKFLKSTYPAWLRPPRGVEVSSSYFENERGMLLYSMLMSPQDKTKKVKGVVCYCHGYGDQCGYTKRAALYKLVEAGYVVAAMDYEGHGRSDGGECRGWRGWGGGIPRGIATH